MVADGDYVVAFTEPDSFRCNAQSNLRLYRKTQPRPDATSRLFGIVRGGTGALVVVTRKDYRRLTELAREIGDAQYISQEIDNEKKQIYGR